MKLLVSTLVAIGGLAALAAPALAQDAQEPAKVAVAAEEAMLAGDWNSATVIAGRAYREDPNLRTEMNLATAYEHEGQVALAIPLYRDLEVKGQFTWTQALYDYRHGPRPENVVYNYAEEAHRRLALLTGE